MALDLSFMGRLTQQYLRNGTNLTIRTMDGANIVDDTLLYNADVTGAPAHALQDLAEAVRTRIAMNLDGAGSPTPRLGGPGQALWDFSTLTGYSADSGATLSLVDTPAVSKALGKSVQKSIMITVPQGVNCQFFWPDLAAAMQNPGGNFMWIVEYVQGNLGANNAITNFYLATNPSFSDFFLWSDQTLRHGVVSTAPNTNPVGGGAPSASAIQTGKVRVQADTGPVQMIFHGVFAAQPIVPTVSITHDDGWLDGYTELAPLLNQYGFKAGFGIIGDLIGSNNALYMQKSHLDKLYLDGHDVMAHGALALNTYPTLQAALADISYNRTWLTDRGYLRGQNGYIFPNGVTEYSATDYYSLLRHIKNLGISFGFLASGEFWHPAGGVNSLTYTRSGMGSTTVAATYLSNLDAAIALGHNATLMLHKIKASGAADGTEVNRPVIQAILAGLSTRQKAGTLRVVSPTEQMAIAGVTQGSY